MLYPADNDKTSTTIDLIYEVAEQHRPDLLEPKEEFDVVGPGPAGRCNAGGPERFARKSQAERKGKEELRKWHYWMERLRL